MRLVGLPGRPFPSAVGSSEMTTRTSRTRSRKPRTGGILCVFAAGNEAERASNPAATTTRQILMAAPVVHSSTNIIARGRVERSRMPARDTIACARLAIPAAGPLTARGTRDGSDRARCPARTDTGSTTVRRWPLLMSRVRRLDDGTEARHPCRSCQEAVARLGPPVTSLKSKCVTEGTLDLSFLRR